MAFDQSTRNRLQKFVNEARALLTEEFTRQLQATYGLDPKSGSVAAVDSMVYLDNRRRQTAQILRDTLTHYLASIHGKGETDRTKQALSRIVREQAFTVLNRLAALRMAESRGFLLESIAKGYNSKGFQLYKQLAGSAQGETGDAYRNYLYSVFDEFSLDLAVLFDRHSAQGRLFPRESALLELLELINHHEIEPLWAEDETIGWIYQYFNSQEERKKMRAESQAPRNSRELAVRNQFFTPRYVVEFLTDNTLGRIWYEMTQGNTGLVDCCRYLVRRSTEVFLTPGEVAPEQAETAGKAEARSQEELLKQPVYIAHRAIKDPRCIRMLDPACGSMHFGLYAFDLYERIYEEAWQLEAELGAEAFFREGNLKPLHQIYDSFEDYRVEIPRLIIEHNIHGVDIDPRAVQIAGLSLWQRAQRAWQQQAIKPQHRPVVRKSNIVCAEPMPGEKVLLQEFASSLNPPVLGQLLETIFDKMELAGEAGTLLKIEEEIQSSIHQARDQWHARSGSNSVGDMFQVELDQAIPQRKLGFDLSGVDDESFWDGAEQLILDALSNYADRAESNADQKRLFAEDAARGFAFIDLCRKRYDAVVMNPPFGDPTPETARMVKDEFPDYADNLYVAFHGRASSLLYDRGFVGVISSRTFVTYRDFEKFRGRLLGETRISALADFGWEVLDGAQVETAAYVTERTGTSADQIGPFYRLLAVPVDQKEIHLLEAIQGGRDGVTFYARPEDVRKLPGAPICYWSSREFIEEASSASQLYPDLAYVGLGASPHAFYFRAHWEVPAASVDSRWKRICRGGDFSPFYRANAQTIAWLENGRCVKEYILKKYPYLNGNYGWKIQDEDKYGHAGLTWGKRNERFNIQAMPSGHIFTDEGQGVVPTAKANPFFLLGYLNSSLVAYFLNLTSGLQKHYIYIRPVPVIDLSDSEQETIGALAREIVCIKQFWDATSEISPLYLAPTLGLLCSEASIESISQLCAERRIRDSEAISKRRSRINQIVLGSTSLGEEDLNEIQALLDSYPDDEPNIDGLLSQSKIEPDVDVSQASISYFVGAAFGRWDIRYAIGERQPPELPDPFDPLPVCPPGMLQNAKGLPAEPKDVPSDYPMPISWPGILVDDESHHMDIVSHVRQGIEVIWKDRAEAIQQEACGILGIKTLRDYFLRPAAFFSDHLKRYSKSRRQAPIYWPLTTKSGSYTLWLYYHRLTPQILYMCVNDLVQPKLENIDQDINTVRGKSARSTQEEKELEKLSDLASELRDFRDELLRLANFWKPNLNDGVQITAAPLWKLFQHKVWQKKLKETWESLEKGDYDWAHLACSIWPDRVLRKCHQDRSLAIAHDVENIFWHEVEVPVKRGKKTTGETKLEWQPKDFTEAELNALVEQTVAEMK